MAMRLMKTNVASLSDLTRVWGKAGVKKTWVRENHCGGRNRWVNGKANNVP